VESSSLFHTNIFDIIGSGNKHRFLMPPVPGKLAPIICPSLIGENPGIKRNLFQKILQKYFVEVISVADTLYDPAERRAAG
jgi:hypothetical protein